MRAGGFPPCRLQRREATRMGHPAWCQVVSGPLDLRKFSDGGIGLNVNRRSFSHHPRTEKRSGPLSLRMTVRAGWNLAAFVRLSAVRQFRVEQGKQKHVPIRLAGPRRLAQGGLSLRLPIALFAGWVPKTRRVGMTIIQLWAGGCSRKVLGQWPVEAGPSFRLPHHAWRRDGAPLRGSSG